MNLNELTQLQLVRIKLLYRQALLYTEKSDEISLILGVQTLDFVVETFLKLIIHTFPEPQNYNPPQSGYYNKIKQMESTSYSPKMNFFRAWDEVVGILRDPANKLSISDLPMRGDMGRLHEIRNDVQHKSAIPHPQDAKKYPTLVESFLKSTYQDVFGVDYDSKSPISLVLDPQIREQLEKAHTALDAKKWNKVATESAIGFHMLLDLARTIALDDPFFQGFIVSNEMFGHEFKDQRQQVERIVEHINNLKENLLVVACGIDYVQYLKYKNISPMVTQYVRGDYGACARKTHSEDEAKGILKFVETQVLQFQASGIHRDLAEKIQKDQGY